MKRSESFMLSAAIFALACVPAQAQEPVPENAQRLYEEAIACSATTGQLLNIIRKQDATSWPLDVSKDKAAEELQVLNDQYFNIVRVLGGVVGKTPDDIRADWNQNSSDLFSERKGGDKEFVMSLFARLEACELGNKQAEPAQENEQRLYEEAVRCSASIALLQVISEQPDHPNELRDEAEDFESWLADVSVGYGKIMHRLGQAIGKTEPEVRSDWERSAVNISTEHKDQGRDGVINLYESVEVCARKLSN